jgi:cardiolipin synthase
LCLRTSNLTDDDESIYLCNAAKVLGRNLARGHSALRQKDAAVVRSQFWTAPNQLTLLRLIFIPFVILCVFDGNWKWALGLIIAAGVSDALDGLLARALDQRTMLGQYLDPIADKMLLSSLFLVLSFVKKIPWKYTVVVFSRDALIVATCVVLYAAVGFRDFRPSIFGKINTVCQIAAVFFVILGQVLRLPWVFDLQRYFLYATFTFTTISGVHYVLVTGHRLRKMEHRAAA